MGIQINATPMITTLVIIVLVVVVVGFVYYYSQPYEKHYFEKAGIKGSFLYNDVIASKGVPISQTIVSQYSNYQYMKAKYDGYILLFAKEKNADEIKYLLYNVTITDKNYKIGIKIIGIGSSIDDVRKAYKRAKPIIDDNMVILMV